MNIDPRFEVPPVGSIVRIVGQYLSAGNSRYMTFMGLPADFNRASRHNVVTVSHAALALVVATDVDAKFDWGDVKVVVIRQAHAV